MIKFAVQGDGAKLHITISGAAGKQAELSNALQECAEGRCTCPTSQYEKLQSVDISQNDDKVQVTLTAKAGEAIERQAIDRCLEYTASQVSGEGESPRR
jgi:hypothetical protein